MAKKSTGKSSTKKGEAKGAFVTKSIYVASAMQGDLIPVSEAAALRGVARNSIYDLIQRGRLRTVDLYGRTFLYRSEIENFEKQKPGPKGEDE